MGIWMKFVSSLHLTFCTYSDGVLNWFECIKGCTSLATPETAAGRSVWKIKTHLRMCNIPFPEKCRAMLRKCCVWLLSLRSTLQVLWNIENAFHVMPSCHPWIPRTNRSKPPLFQAEICATFRMALKPRWRQQRSIIDIMCLYHR